MAAKKIQSLFITLYNKIQFAMKTRGKAIINKKSFESICSLGYSICNRFQIISFYYFKDLEQLKINVFDVALHINQTFFFDNIEIDAETERAMPERIIKILRRIKFKKEEGKYILLDVKVLKEQEQHIKIIESIAESTSKDSKKKCIYTEKKLIGRAAYEIEILYVSEEKIEVLTVKCSDKKENCFQIDYDFGSYLGLSKDPSKEEQLGKLILGCIFANSGGSIYVDCAAMRKMIGVEVTKLKLRSILKLQSKHKSRLALNSFLNLFLQAKRSKRVLVQFGLAIGPAWHYIKVLVDINNNEKVFIKSNKAVNEIEIPLRKLMHAKIVDNNIETYNAKKYIKRIVPKLLAFDPTKNMLLYYLRDRSVYSRESNNSDKKL